MNWIDILLMPLVAALIGLAVWYFQSRIEQIRQAEVRLHDTRRAVYIGLLEPYIRMFAGSKDPLERAKALAQVTSFEYRKVAFNFNLIGSDSVVRAFNGMMQYFYSVDTASGKPDDRRMIELWGGLLLEIRRSVGDPKTKLKPVDMLRGQINDIDKVLGSPKGK